jgi:hypothetical protein
MANMRGATTWCVVVAAALGCRAGEPDEPTGERAQRSTGSGLSDAQVAAMAARAKLAASRQFLRPSAQKLTAAVADGSWAEALDLPADAVISTTLTGPAEASQVRTSLGAITPILNGSFVLLSTGVAGAGTNGLATPEPGTDFGAVGADGDTTSLSLELNVPAGANFLSFQYNFLSTESPDFIHTIFNDAVSLQVVDDTGTRDFPVASVNNSHFFEMSDSRGKNSGFDIYTDDPSDVDFTFGTGLPDSGLTDFQSFTVGVTGSHVTLTFTIQDNGDGIVDSAVLLDALQFAVIDTVDPNPDLVVAPGTLIQSPDDLATRGRHVRGVVADAASDVVLRMKLPVPGTVQFQVAGATPSDGALSSIAGSDPAAVLQSTTVQTTGGDNYAFAVYRAPPDFNTGRPGESDAVDRTIQITAAFTPTGAGTPFSSEVNLVVKRPPVVLAGGLWSDALDWTPLVAGTPFISNDARFAVTYADHTYHCNSEVRVVPVDPSGGGQCPWLRATPPTGEVLCTPGQSNAIADATRDAIANVRRLGIAATQVDVIALGDAGLHARAYINAPTYRNPGNLNLGDVNRLITLDTPHLGSKVADAIVQARDLPSPTLPSEDFLCHARRTESLGLPAGGVEPGEIDEMTTANATLAETDVPGHALIGSNGKVLASTRYRRRIAVMSITLDDIKTNTGTNIAPCGVGPGACTTIWGPPNALEDHDTFASVTSQAGGLPASATTSFPTNASSPNDPNDTWTDLLHTTRTQPVSTAILSLLNTATDSAAFAVFPAAQPGLRAPGAATQKPMIATLPAPSAAAAVAGTLRIVSPAGGTEVFAGDSLSVQVVADGGFVPVSVAAVLGDSFTTSETAPFTVTLGVPSEALGATKLVAVASNASDQTLVSNLVVLDVKTRAAIERVNVVNRDPFLFGVGKLRHLTVTGIFSDGITRDITSPAVGTVYRSSNPAIVAVSSDGTVSSVAPGIATVIVQNGSVQDSITVTVTPNATPRASAGADVALVCAQPGTTVPVHLDGTGSFDPDGDPLTFAWFENGVQIASGPAPEVALAPGIHAITLVVSDAGTTAQDGVQVSIAEDDQPPDVEPKPMIVLFPPDLRYHHFQLSDCARSVDTCSGKGNINEVGQIVAIHSDERDVMHLFDPPHDMVILGPSSFKLRNQRSLFGNGRVYEIEFTVHDNTGNVSAPHSCFVGVKQFFFSPTPVNDGRVFTVLP